MRHALLALLAGTILTHVHGAVIDWSSTAGTTAWSTGTNWSGNTAPANNTTADIARFNQTAYANLPDASTRSVNGVQIGDGTTGTASLTITTSNLTIGGNGITMYANAGAAIIGKITTSGAQTWMNNSSNSLTLSGNNALASAVTFDGTGSIVLSGANTVTNSSVMIKNGSGSLTLSGNNNFSTGGLTLNAGILNINDSSALSDGTGSNATLTINGGSIDNSSGTAVGVADMKIVINTDFTFLASTTLNMGVGNVTLGTAAGTTRIITTNGSQNQALTIDGVISNGTTANSLTKAGTGGLTLDANNTYTGLTTVSAGTLRLNGANNGSGGLRLDTGTLILGNDAALGSGTLTINGGHLDASAARTITNTQVWNGNFTFDGTNALTLGTSSANSAISLGTAAGTSRTLTLATSGTLLTVNGIISDGTTAKALVVTGPGDLKLNSANTFTGGFAFGGGGELFVFNAAGVGTGTFTLNNGAIIDNWVATGTTTTNTGLVINGDFTNLGRFNLFTLGTGSGNLGTSAGTARTIYAQGGSGRVLAINTNLANGATATGIVKAGIGDLSLGGNNTFTGGVTVTEGRLNVNSAGALGTGTLTINGGEIGNLSGVLVTNSNNNAQVWNSDLIFASTATGALDLGTGAVSLGTTAGTTRTINVAAATNRPLTIGGVISNGTTATGIVKTGQGILNLSGNNTYTGITTITNNTANTTGTANFTGINSGGGAVVVTGDIDLGALAVMAVNGASGKFTNTTSYTVTGSGILNVGDTTAGNGLANRLNTGATLALGGTDGAGTFNLVRGSTTANSQSLVSLTAGEGSNAVGISGSGGGAPTLTFSGATPYTRSSGGFVNFATTALTVNMTSAPSGTGNVASGLLVGGILNGNDFIKAQAGALTATTYTADAWSSGNNTNVTVTSNLSGTPGLTTGSLRFNTAGNQTLTLAGANTIQSGGIIVGSSTTATTSGTITGGSLKTGAAGGDLWVYVGASKGLTINSIIADNSGSSLSLGGTGTLTLTGANTYTGRTTIGNGSTLAYDNGAGTTVNNAQGSGTIRNNNTSGALTLNQTGSGLSLGIVSGVSGSTVVFTGTGDTTIKNVLGTADQTVQVSGGAVTLRTGSTTAANLLVDGGTLNLATGITINKASGTQTLTLSSGQINSLNSSSLFMRANGSGATFTATQTGGTLSMTGGNSTQFQLGTNTSTTSTSTYNLSGGTLGNLATGGIIIYADTGGNSSGTFNLTGGTLLNAGSISGNQGAGAKQAFVWTGGTLATATYTATNLTSTAGAPVVTGTTNILTNGGGTLAPGDIGTTGRTLITGSYAVTSANAVLDIDIGGGTVTGSTFQNAPGSGFYDQLFISGNGLSVTLGGKLNVRLLDGYTPTGGYQIIRNTGTSGVITGTFSNLVTDNAGDSRVVLSDGLASFTVTNSGGFVTLDGYADDNFWGGDGSASSVWSDKFNWLYYAPSQAGHVAKFDDNAYYGGTQSVLLDANETVGSIQLDSTGNQFTITSDSSNPGKVLTLDNNGSASTISAIGSHAINVPLVLANNLTVTTVGSGDSLSIGGDISGSGKTLTKTGSGTLTLSGNNTYSGGTNLNAGTLTLNSIGALGSSGTIGMNGGTLKYTSNNTTDYSDRFSTLANQAYNIYTNGQSVTMASGLTSSGGTLSKKGTGTLTLTGANTYSGGTMVFEGTLATGATGTFGSGDINLMAGAGLTLGNNNSILDNATLIFAPTAFVSLSFTGTEIMGGLQSSSGTTLGAGVFTAAELNAFFSSSAFTGTGSVSIMAIPEPSTSVVLMALCSGLFVLSKRRRPRP